MSAIVTAAAYRRRAAEADLESAVTDLVAIHGGRLFHVNRADTSPELVDLLDWFILAPHIGAALLIEAKSQRRQITPGQREVAALAAGCTDFLSGIVRPEPRDGEWSYDELLDILNGGGQ